MNHLSDVGRQHHSDASQWPPAGLQALGRCPVCDHGARVLMHADLRDDLFKCAPGRWTMYRCSGCGLGYLDPRPNQETISLAYQNYFTHDEAVAGPVEIPGSGFMNVLKNRILQQYLYRQFGLGAGGGSQRLAGLMRLRPRFKAMVDSSMRHLPRRSTASTLLDVGCGSGRFMVSARNAGWLCAGTETDPVAAESARRHGFEILQGPLSELRDTGRRFHAITISHVIEHVHEPRELLRDALALLEPGGYFWIETPNIQAFGHEVFGRAWLGLDPPRHLQIFDHAGLSKLLEEIGFKQVRTAPWQLDWEIIVPTSLRLARLQEGNAAWQGADLSRAEQVGKKTASRREFITLLASR